MNNDDLESGQHLDAQGSEPTSPERQSFLDLTRSLAGLPLDQAAAALETSAAIASISLRAGIEFLRAVPHATQFLAPKELRDWGEMGRRLAMSDFEAAASFFAQSVDDFGDLPRPVQASLFQLCLRQMTLSTVVGRETLHSFPAIYKAIATRVPVVRCVAR